jgi:hypothetical protein
MKPTGVVQTHFIATKARVTKKWSSWIKCALVAIKRVCTAPVGFIRSRKLSKSLEKLFQTISRHKMQGKGFSWIILFHISNQYQPSAGFICLEIVQNCFSIHRNSQSRARKKKKKIHNLLKFMN